MSKQDRNTAFTIAIVLIVCTLSLVVVGASLWRIIEPGLSSTLAFFGLQVKLSTSDYNFAVPDKPEPSTPQPEPEEQPVEEAPVTPEPEEEQSQDNEVAVDQEIVYVVPRPPLIVPANYSYNFPVPTAQAAAEDNTFGFRDAILNDAQLVGYGSGTETPQSNLFLSIPSIGVKSPVIQGLGGENLLDQGFWVYPGSKPIGQGEMVLLCHRRFFGPYDPRSCWFLDTVAIGQEILLRRGEDELKYKIISTAVVEGEDSGIYNISEDKNYLKIVTCHPLYSNAQRFVVLAELQP